MNPFDDVSVGDVLRGQDDIVTATGPFQLSEMGVPVARYPDIPWFAQMG
jgi:hypothetical protein